MVAVLAALILTVGLRRSVAREETSLEGGLYPGIDFQLLAQADPDQPDRITEEVRTWYRRDASIQGYMIPLEVRNREVSRFLLVRTLDLCHFGASGPANSWVEVEMEAGRSAPMAYWSPVVVSGVFVVEPLMRDGRAEGLYRMKGEEVSFR